MLEKIGMILDYEVLEFLVIVRLGLFIYRNMTSLKTRSTSEFQVKLTCNRLFRALPKVCLHFLLEHYTYLQNLFFFKVYNCKMYRFCVEISVEK